MDGGRPKSAARMGGRDEMRVLGASCGRVLILSSYRKVISISVRERCGGRNKKTITRCESTKERGSRD